MILVVGATGRLGGSIARALLDSGKAVRVLVRDGSAFDDARAETMPGDLKDPDSLRQACEGVDIVVTTANAIAPRRAEDTIESVDRLGNRNLIAASTSEGVRHFVFVSVLGASADHVVPFVRAKGETERELRESGLSWTILQPDAFMDVWFPFIIGPALEGRAVTLVGEGKQRHSMVAMQDVVRYAMAAVEQKEAANSVLAIGGEPVTWRDVIDTFSEVLGREIPVQTVPPGEPVPGLPDFVAELLASLELYESPLDMSEHSRTFGVKTTSLHDFVRGFVAAET
ncbi:MAG: SDR family oxidoreductase [Actinomycetota bacterium]|nr:SDR family oxidoreductase [Actinomycetota bacterium]